MNTGHRYYLISINVKTIIIFMIRQKLYEIRINLVEIIEIISLEN